MKRQITNDFLIDGEPMLVPDAGIGVKSTDIEAVMATDESGVTHRKLRRSDVKTWEFSYAVLTAEEYVYIRGLMKGKATFSFTFTNEEGTTEEVRAYCKETSASYWSNRRGLYKNLQFSIIQC